MKKCFNVKLPVLSPRLETIINMITPGQRIIDVGTDHCLIPITAIAKGIRDIGIATDIRVGPLKIAKKNILRFGFQDKIQLLQTDGLKGITIKTDDSMVIAGMGGYEIISIMQETMPVCENIILQPQKSHMELRQFLSENGYEIQDEKIAKESHRFYVAIKAKFTGKKYYLNLTRQIVGPVILNSRNELVKDYICYLIKQMEKMKKGNSEFSFVKSELEKIETEFEK